MARSYREHCVTGAIGGSLAFAHQAFAFGVHSLKSTMASCQESDQGVPVSLSRVKTSPPRAIPAPRRVASISGTKVAGEM